jgi:hypothetical protein
VALNETFNYVLVYNAGDTVHTVTISDTVPAATTVLGAGVSLLVYTDQAFFPVVLK